MFNRSVARRVHCLLIDMIRGQLEPATDKSTPKNCVAQTLPLHYDCEQKKSNIYKCGPHIMELLSAYLCIFRT